MYTERLIEKYKGMITDTCSCCGNIHTAVGLECGCETKSRSELAEQVVRDLESLLKAENEIDASDAPEVKHDAYAVVRNLECEADSTDTAAHTSSAALETRIDSEIGCVYCSGSGVIPVWTEHGMNSMDCYCQTTKKES